jgi:hypothetical protein
MVRALLDGSKTQTRRVIKPQPNGDYLGCSNIGHPKFEQWFEFSDVRIKCPHLIGSRIWVKETHYWDRFEKIPKTKPADFPIDFYYRADGDCCQQIPECCCGTEEKPKWRPSIFMPRWASRIELEVTAVTVERVRDISQQDAIAEGIHRRDADFVPMWRDYSGHDEVFGPNPIESYRSLWDSINVKKHPWSSNPFVFVYSFRRVKP